VSDIMGGEFRQLLTDEDRRAYLHKLLAHRFKAHEQVQLPTLDQYDSISSDEGLGSIGREMCRQLGFKPSGLTIRFSDSSLPSGYRISHDSKTILIDPKLKQHPYSSGAELALAVTAYALEHLSHISPDRAFTEFATIETGLGLWIINALRPRLGLKEKIYHLIDSSWFHNDGIQLEAYSPRQYVERFVSFTHENHVTVDTYLPHVVRPVRYLFPKFVLSQSSRYLPAATLALRHKHSADLLWVKVILVALILSGSVVLGVYALASQQAPVNPAIERSKQNALHLKKAYIECQNDASDQQSKYDPNDLFLTRQVDDTKTRCESLRNQYNYAVDQYQNLR
jgi:hypothetical protein